MKRELKVGQTVWLEPMGNAARYQKEPCESTISKIGKKYIYVGERNEIRFFADNLKHDNGNYSAQWLLHLSDQEMNEEFEKRELSSNLYTFFGGGYSFNRSKNLSLDKLRRIKAIIDED